MPFLLVRNDIVHMPVDVIVNAANSGLKMGGGVCGSIFNAAGVDALTEACDRIGFCQTGDVAITPAFQLPSKWIIHAVGPVWQGGKSGEAVHLADCYRKAMDLALLQGAKSIAFPLISTGIYGYPKAEALSIATETITTALLEQELMVYLVVFDQEALALSESWASSIAQYIDNHYVDKLKAKDMDRVLEPHDFNTYQASCPTMDYDISDSFATTVARSKRKAISQALEQLDAPFATRLIQLIDDRGYSDVEVYKRANIDRKLFSKLRNNPQYMPSKTTAIAFAIALRLNLEDTNDLLSRAGYTLSNSSKFDTIIRYFIENGNYSIYQINEALFAFDQVLLGA